jgi:hypothetical protein
MEGAQLIYVIFTPQQEVNILIIDGAFEPAFAGGSA